MKLASFSVRNRTLIAMAVLAVVAWGTLNYLDISRREDPEIKISLALVITIWPGKSAEDVERLVTRKLEEEIEKLSTLQQMKSITRENLSLILVDIDFNADTAIEWQRLRNRLEEARKHLPPGVIGPRVMDDFGDVTAMIYALRSRTAEPRELKYWADQLKARIRALPSVGKVNLLGEQQEVIYIEGPLDSFTTYGFSPLVAARILEAQNVNLPSGYLRTPDANLRLDTPGSVTWVDQIREAVLDVASQSGAPLKVKDVFSVRQSYEDPPISFFESSSEPAIGLDIRMAPGNNIVQMGREVQAVVEDFRTQLPPHIQLDLVHDQPREVDEFVGSFLQNLWEGLVLVILVMLPLMGLRATAIVAVALPLSIVATLAVMPAMKVDLEQVAIAAFIVALGMLVDNAIIVVDNIDRHLARGEDPVTAATRGTDELLRPILVGTMGTVFAFGPLLMLKDEVGAYVRSLPLVVSASMLASLVVAVTVTPLLAARLMRHSTGQASGTGIPKGRVSRVYAAALRGGLKRKPVVLLLALAAFVGAAALLPRIGFSFFPEVDRDQFTIDLWLPEGSGIAKTTAKVREVEEILRQEPEVRSWASFVGEGGPRFHITVMPQFNSLNYARLLVNTRDPKATRPLANRLKDVFRERIVGARITPKAILMGIPVEAPVALRVTGPDLQVMGRISQEIQQILRDTPGTDMVRDDLGQEVPSIRVDLDAEAGLMVGVTATETAVALLTAHEGLPATEVHHQDVTIPVRLRAAAEDRVSGRTIQHLRVPSSVTGAKVPLNAIATLRPYWSTGVIHRTDNQRSVTVMAEVHERLAADVLREALPKIRALDLPPGYSLSIEGEEKERSKAFGQLTTVFFVIVGLLLAMLTMQFHSLKRASVVLASVPLAIIGAVLGLWLSGNTFSFMAFLGVVSLAGMVIKNAVVWVEFVDRELDSGLSIRDAVVQAGIWRFRPILLTTATTVLGLLPLGLFGGVLWEGMAWAMIAGLLVSTLLTLYVIPVLFEWLCARDPGTTRE